MTYNTFIQRRRKERLPPANRPQ